MNGRDSGELSPRSYSIQSFTIARVGEIWSFTDLEAFDAVCGELHLKPQLLDTGDNHAAHNLTLPVVIQGPTAWHKAKCFVERMRELTGTDWLVVELPDSNSHDG